MVPTMSKMDISRCVLSVVLCYLWAITFADETQPSRAHYLANAGTVIEHGNTKIAFDPLFRNDFGTYDLVPADIEAAFMVGMPPFWFYFSDEGRQIVDKRINATHTIGVHVPTKMPYDPESRPDELQGVDLFRRQGGTRNITITN